MTSFVRCECLKNVFVGYGCHNTHFGIGVIFFLNIVDICDILLFAVFEMEIKFEHFKCQISNDLEKWQNQSVLHIFKISFFVRLWVSERRLKNSLYLKCDYPNEALII